MLCNSIVFVYLSSLRWFSGGSTVSIHIELGYVIVNPDMWVMFTAPLRNNFIAKIKLVEQSRIGLFFVNLSFTLYVMKLKNFLAKQYGAQNIIIVLVTKI